jgi:hypothetical protein
MSITNDLTREIIEYIYTQGGYAFRVNDTGVYDKAIGRYRASAKKGICDILAVYNSRFIGIEIKTGRDRLRDEQIGFIKNIEHCGGKVFVIGNMNEFIEQWRAWLDNIK